jgi:hypothetical protein
MLNKLFGAKQENNLGIDLNTVLIYTLAIYLFYICGL